MTAEDVIIEILDSARWKLINIRDQFAESRYTEVYDEYDDKLGDLIEELDPDYFKADYSPSKKIMGEMGAFGQKERRRYMS